MKKIFFLILIFAFFFRFYNYSHRFVFNQDQARDAVVAEYALDNHLIPLLGSPSSAGPFNFGPWYFWLIMLFTKLSFGWYLGPWVGFSLLSVSTVVAYFLIGKKIAGYRLAVLMGLIAAFSPAQVLNAPDMLNTVIVGCSSAWAIYFLARSIIDQKMFPGLLFGFFVGLSINFHFQSWGLITLIAALALFSRRLFLVSGLGWFLSFIPLVIFDLGRRGVWLNSVIYYYTEGVKKFYVPIRWLTEIRDFWPQLFGSVITGFPLAGYLLIICLLLSLFFCFRFRKIPPQTILVLFLSLIIQVFLMRNYRGVRSREYLIAFHGLIICLTSWSLFQIYLRQKIIASALIVLFLSLAAYSNFLELNRHSQSAEILKLNSLLPSRVQIFQTPNANMVSLPLFYLKYHAHQLDEQGIKIGICDQDKIVCPQKPPSFAQSGHYYLYRLADTTGFELLTPELIYGWLMVNYSTP